MKNIRYLFLIVIFAIPAGAAYLGIEVHNISDDKFQGGVSFATGYSTDSFKLSNQYIQLDCEPFNNAMSWRVDAYTNNADAALKLSQRGGLIGIANNAARVPVAWTLASNGALPAASSVTAAGCWLWLKDKGDKDDPATPGHSTVVYGSSNCVPATYNMYLEANFKNAPAGTYKCTIWFDMYQVLDTSVPSYSVADYRPKERIITPNGDGKNDFAFFGAADGIDFPIKIYNVAGHEIKTLSSSSQSTWDATDNAGRVVESGVYIYQFNAHVQGGTKLISGTIVVAK